MITYMSSMAKITVLTFYWKDWSTIVHADHRLSMPQLCCWFSVLLDRFCLNLFSLMKENIVYSWLHHVYYIQKDLRMQNIHVHNKCIDVVM